MRVAVLQRGPQQGGNGADVHVPDEEVLQTLAHVVDVDGAEGGDADEDGGGAEVGAGNGGEEGGEEDGGEGEG